MKKILTASSIVFLSLTRMLISETTSLDSKPHRLNFGLLEFQYDYLKEDAVNFGMGVRMKNTINVKDKRYNRNNYLTNIESYLGYRFPFVENTTFLPYIALGYTHYNREDMCCYLRDWSYLAFGGELSYRFGPVFSLGLHLKGYRPLHQKHIIEDKENTKLLPNWSTQIGIPLVWNLGDDRAWELQFEPYYLYMSNLLKSHNLGSKLAFGYRF